MTKYRKRLLIGVVMVLCMIIIRMHISNSFQYNNNQLKPVEYNKSKVLHKIDIWDSPSCDFKEMSIKENVENADEIIEGKVISTSYYSYQGVAWTKLRLNVTDVLSGNLQQKDEISVYVMGGYISYSDYLEYYCEKQADEVDEEKLVEMTEIGDSMHKKGEMVVLALEKASENSPFEKDAYERTSCMNSEFKYQKNLRKYKVIQGGKEYSKNELYRKIKNAK